MDLNRQNYNPRKSSFSVFFSTILPWIPWLHIYSAGVPGVTFGYLVLVMLAGYSLLSYNKCKKHSEHALLTVFLCYAMVILPLSLLFSEDIFLLQIANRCLKQLLLIYVVVSVMPRFLDFDKYVSSLRVVTYIGAAAILIQFVLMATTGRSLEFKIPFLNYANDWSNEKDFAAVMAQSGRLTSIFLEPSHYSNFAVQYLMVTLFYHPKEREPKAVYIEAVIITVSILSSVTSSGMIYCGVVWTAYLFIRQRPEEQKGKVFFRKILVLIIISVAIIFIINNERVNFAIARMLPSYANSQNVWVKIIGGQEEFLSLSPILKIIGAGFGNLSPTFMTGLFYTLYCTGIIGTIIIVAWFIKALKNKASLSKVAAIVFFLVFLIQPGFYAPTLINYSSLMRKNDNT